MTKTFDQAPVEFCQNVKGWAVFFDPNMEGFYAKHSDGRTLGYCDSEPEILDEIDGRQGT